MMLLLHLLEHQRLLSPHASARTRIIRNVIKADGAFFITIISTRSNRRHHRCGYFKIRKNCVKSPKNGHQRITQTRWSTVKSNWKLPGAVRHRNSAAEALVLWFPSVGRRAILCETAPSLRECGIVLIWVCRPAEQETGNVWSAPIRATEQEWNDATNSKQHGITHYKDILNN